MHVAVCTRRRVWLHNPLDSLKVSAHNQHATSAIVAALMGRVLHVLMALSGVCAYTYKRRGFFDVCLYSNQLSALPGRFGGGGGSGALMPVAGRQHLLTAASAHLVGFFEFAPSSRTETSEEGPSGGTLQVFTKGVIFCCCGHAASHAAVQSGIRAAKPAR